MIYLIGKTILNGEALSLLKKKYESIKMELSEIHDYHVLAIEGSYELADVIRETNLVNVTFDGQFLFVSDNIRNLKLLIRQLSVNDDSRIRDFAQYLIHNFPKLFNSLKELK